MMSIKRYESNERMSQAVVHNGVAYLAGQTGEPGADITEQTKQVLARIDQQLALVGSDKTKVLSATIWLKDIADFDKMNAVWDKWCAPGHTPARATGEVRLCEPELYIEIIVTAAIA